MQDIDDIISDYIKQFDNKILGINFLEKLKYPLIDKIKTYSLSKISKQSNKEYLIKNQNINIFVKIEKNTKNISKIKKIINNDNLSIILNGLKTITIHEKKNSRAINQQYLSKSTGIVLAKDTIIDELIAKDTILLDISIIYKENNIDL